MLRTVIVVIHAVAGIVGLLVGLAAFRLPSQGNRQSGIQWAYLTCLAVLLVSLVALIVLDWPQLQAVAQIVFVALAGLGGAMLYRMLRARRETVERTAGWQDRYINHIFFTYVSLWIGFLVLPALNLPSPQFSIPVVAVAVLLLGTLLVSRYKKRVL